MSRLDRARQFRARFAQPVERPRDAGLRDDESRGRSPWMTSAEGADLVRCPTRKAFRMWAQRAGIIPVHRGRVVLYARADVAGALRANPVPSIREAV